MSLHGSMRPPRIDAAGMPVSHAIQTSFETKNGVSIISNRRR